MKRYMEVEISNCYECVLLETHDSFSSHQFECPYHDKITDEIDDPQSEERADDEVETWFRDCRKWGAVPSSLS